MINLLGYSLSKYPHWAVSPSYLSSSNARETLASARHDPQELFWTIGSRYNVSVVLIMKQPLEAPFLAKSGMWESASLL